VENPSAEESNHELFASRQERGRGMIQREQVSLQVRTRRNPRAYVVTHMGDNVQSRIQNQVQHDVHKQDGEQLGEASGVYGLLVVRVL
jgi:hypothetical protein